MPIFFSDFWVDLLHFLNYVMQSLAKNRMQFFYKPKSFYFIAQSQSAGTENVFYAKTNAKRKWQQFCKMREIKSNQVSPESQTSDLVM